MPEPSPTAHGHLSARTMPIRTHLPSRLRHGQHRTDLAPR